uniref:Uncharacterized protein n=1 Tax=Siphoviridae sp. ctOCb13 TaxID=2825477 RepID=A0A8S5Q0I5_9CAUD|nr:MAG TPA: hypothetical protein [Siphoviridae sp. ctOCb13]
MGLYHPHLLITKLLNNLSLPKIMEHYFYQF